MSHSSCDPKLKFALALRQQYRRKSLRFTIHWSLASHAGLFIALVAPVRNDLIASKEPLQKAAAVIVV